MQEVFLFSNVGLIQDRSACQTKIFEWFLVVRYLARGVTQYHVIVSIVT